MTTWQSELDRLGARPAPLESAAAIEVRGPPGAEAGAVALGTLEVGGKTIELQVRRRALRYEQSSFVAVAIVPDAEVRGTAYVRTRELARLGYSLRDASLVTRLGLLLALPFLVVFLPGYFLVVSAVLLGKRASGSAPQAVATEPGFGRRFVVEARSRDDAASAAPPSVQRTLVEMDQSLRAQLEPGRIAIVRELDGPADLQPFVHALRGHAPGS